MLIVVGATSLITFFVIALAYLSDVISKKEHVDLADLGENTDDGLLNDLDEAFIRHCSPFGRFIRARSP